MNPHFPDITRVTSPCGAQRKPFSMYLCLLALVGALPSFAATLTVTNTNDSGSGSLRDAIATALSRDTINFNLPAQSTITVASALAICNSQTLTISGPGASQLAISGNGAAQVFNICSGANVTLSGLTIEKGSSNIGGGLYNSGTLTVTNSTLAGNSADGGGGIFNTGTLTVTDTTFTGNSAVGACSGGEGGALNNSGGAVTVSDSTLSGNSAGCEGGGIENNYGTLTLTNSTVSGNSAANEGGGIDNNNFGILAVTNSTIAGNSAAAGAGIDNFDTITLKSTLLANNAPGGSCLNFGGAINSQGYNLSDDNTCASFFTGPGDQDNAVKGAGLDPKGLQNNGGPTQTIALLPNNPAGTSPAVDAIPVTSCTDTNGKPVTTDQRGVTRPQGKGCDIGAYELVQSVPFSSFSAYLAIDTGRHPGFVLTSLFTLGSASAGLNPATEPMTLQIANYTLTLPAGSFHRLWNASNAPYGYEGTVNGATVALGLVPLGNNTFSFDAAGSPVTFPGIKNPVTVTLTFGTDTGTTSVKALITSY